MKLIAFDVDGTLLNTFDTIFYHLNESLTENGFYKIDEPEYVRQALGYGSYYLIEQALIFHYNHFYDKQVTEQMLEYYTNRYNSDPSHLTKPYEGIVDLLNNLKEDGYTLVAYSNKPDTVLQGVMSDIFQDNLFDYIEGAKPETPVKPDPTALNAIIEKFNISKDDILYIGDSEVDINTAKNAGVKVMAVSWGFRDKSFLEQQNADYLVDNTTQAKEIIDSLRG